jgi:hypothetical protein
MQARNDYERSPSRLLDAPEIGISVERLRACAPCNAFFDRPEQSVDAMTAAAKKKIPSDAPLQLAGK